MQLTACRVSGIMQSEHFGSISYLLPKCKTRKGEFYMKNELPPVLYEKAVFSRQEYSHEMASEYELNESQIRYTFQKKLNDGNIIRIGRNRYSPSEGKTIYSYEYSEISKQISGILSAKYIDLDFRIFELIQLNQFANHLFAHNTIFVSVESDQMDSVFDTLLRKFPGKVMIKPDIEMYYRYLQDDEIVIIRLPSESPKGIREAWHSRLEKILTDVLTDKLISRIVTESEKAAIVKGAYQEYAIDENTMMRYARRKGAVKKLEDALQEGKGDMII